MLEEEGVDYISRHLDIHGTMDQLEPWYLAVNPAGVVPTLLFRGNAVAESKDISLFAIDEVRFCQNTCLIYLCVCVQVSKVRKLLPNEIREEVLKLVELHYEDAPVETLTMGTMASSNKMMGVIGSRKLKGAIQRLEKMKTDQPNLEEVIEGKIRQKEEQQKTFSNPQRAKDEAFGKVITVLDHLEEKLKEGDFLCGGSYTLADAVFTCLLARLSMIKMLKQELRSRQKLASWWGRMASRPSFQKAGVISSPITPRVIIKKFCSIL